MSFLARIAARAMGTQDEGVSALVPKDRGLAAMRVAAPVEEATEDQPEPDTGPASRLVARRAAAPAGPEPEKDEEKAKDEAQRTTRRAAAEDPKQEGEKAARAAWRAAAMQPDEEQPQRADEPVSRATPPAPEEQPADDQPLPEETRNEKEPQKALALRPVRRDGGTGPVAGIGAAPPAASQWSGAHDFDRPNEVYVPDDWRPPSGPEDFGGEDEAEIDRPAPSGRPERNWHQDPPPLQIVPGIGHPAEQAGVVIEQIDVFVQEPQSREPARPRLSDPARLVAARYLRTL